MKIELMFDCELCGNGVSRVNRLPAACVKEQNVNGGEEAR